jgi:murein DD-endopeptidase MepM/ murein hydrolase activator NlpD
LDFDYHPPKQTSKPSNNRLPWYLGLFLAVLLLVWGVVYFGFQPEATPISVRAEAKLPPAPPQPQQEVIVESIHPGDTITSLLGNYFSPQDIYQLNKQSKDVFPLTKICAGQPYKICLLDGDFERFEYDIDADEQLIIEPGKDQQFSINRAPIPYTVEISHIQGTITSSLFEAVADLGEKPELALALADIFAWDIDFILDIRAGDSFQALVEKRFREGEEAGYGDILAAEFTNRGETFQAFRFQDGNKRASYYDQNGDSVRKAFLKAPLSFSRISSGFTMHRFHPITKTWKAHPAIDYVAPTGTPIKAVGDASITRIGYTKGNGNFIELRHSNGYTSLYLHMSKFARGMKKGKRVAQGQTIGYVGSTGLATGPHLCFRMRKNGAPINPTKIKSPAAAPINQNNLATFKAAIDPWAAWLEGRGATIQVARPVQAESQRSLEQN